jgi:hypothetical protein
MEINIAEVIGWLLKRPGYYCPVNILIEPHRQRLNKDHG